MRIAVRPAWRRETDCREIFRKCKWSNGNRANICVRKQTSTAARNFQPVVNGIQATASIKNLYPFIKVVILSSINDIPSITRAIEAGADAFIFKDASPQELKKAFIAVQNNELYIDSSIAHLFPMYSKEKRSVKEVVQWSDNLITSREQEVLQLITEGYNDRQISDKLFLSFRTVEAHRKNLMAKFKLNDTDALVKFARNEMGYREPVPGIKKGISHPVPAQEL